MTEAADAINLCKSLRRVLGSAASTDASLI